MTAKASAIDLAKLPAALQPQAPKPISAATLEALADANRFEDGQISGPFGPKFGGFGEIERPSARQVAVEVAIYGLLIGVGSLALILVGHWL